MKLKAKHHLTKKQSGGGEYFGAANLLPFLFYEALAKKFNEECRKEPVELERRHDAVS